MCFIASFVEGDAQESLEVPESKVRAGPWSSKAPTAAIYGRITGPLVYPRRDPRWLVTSTVVFLRTSIELSLMKRSAHAETQHITSNLKKTAETQRW